MFNKSREWGSFQGGTLEATKTACLDQIADLAQEQRDLNEEEVILKASQSID